MTWWSSAKQNTERTRKPVAHGLLLNFERSLGPSAYLKLLLFAQKANDVRFRGVVSDPSPFRVDEASVSGRAAHGRGFFPWALPLTERQAPWDERSEIDLRIDDNGLDRAVAIRRRQPINSIIGPAHAQNYCPFAFTAQPGLFDLKGPMVCILALIHLNSWLIGKQDQASREAEAQPNDTSHNWSDPPHLASILE
jgi:hypothetical protein